MKMKKFILFDNDGVLVETEKWYYEAILKSLHQFDIDIPFDEYMRIMAEGKNIWQKASDNGISQKDINRARNERNDYYQEFLQTEDILIEGVKDVLQELSKKYTMAIVTTSRRVDFDIIHNGRGIIDFMDFVLCEEDYNYCKPHPEPYLTALNRFSSSKKDAIVVEDSERGLTSAYRAGIDCVTVKNEFTKTQDFANSTHKINNLKELLTLL
jgi:HAD superfamily hydrolase (TIGR01509 family)